ncbi:hypothetical protein LEN26_016460 [Aphanomyces euteiches]|nr:hypothetical protein LEN26_016460 [Aphanomyces euteiches]KAH9189533.1 hypothetical protein AeNC1_008488 [Aphanomyces euteiches]
MLRISSPSSSEEDLSVHFVKIVVAATLTRAMVHLQQDAEATPLLFTPPKPHPLVGLSLIALSAGLASLISTCAKYESIDLVAMEAVFWRFVVAYVFVLVLALYGKVNLVVPWEFQGDLVGRCVFGFAAVGSLFWAISQMNMADASTIAFTSPILTCFLGAWILGELVGLVEMICAFVSILGVVLVARPSIFFPPPIIVHGSSYAPLAALASAVFTALSFVHLRRLKSLHYIVVTHYFLLVGAAFSGLWVLVQQGQFDLDKSSNSVAQTAIMTGFIAFLADLALTKGLQFEGASVASVVRYLDIVLVFVWDTAILRERLSWWSVGGAVLITLAVVVLFVRRVRQGDSRDDETRV